MGALIRQETLEITEVDCQALRNLSLYINVDWVFMGQSVMARILTALFASFVLAKMSDSVLWPRG